MNIKNNLRGFLLFDSTYFKGRLNSRYLPNTERILTPLYVMFYLIGIVWAIKNTWYIPVLYALLLFPIQTLSRGTPDAARAVYMVPMIFLFILFGIGWSYRTLIGFRQYQQIIRYIFPPHRTP